MTSRNALANAKLLFNALAAREPNLDEPIPDGRIMDVAVQIGLEGDEFDLALDYAADQGWFEDASLGVQKEGERQDQETDHTRTYLKIADWSRSAINVG